jgi:cytohesin
MGDIFRAAEEGNEEEVKRLLDTDPALLEREDVGENRPLVLAAHYGHLGVARLLIERGVNVNATGDNGNTALHDAADQGHAEVVALLLREGAHANSRSDEGVTPLMWACNSGHLGAVKVFVQHMEGQGLDDGDNHGWTALHYASFMGREEVVRFLLLAGADPTVTNNRGRTPRALAEENDFIEIIREGRARCVAVFQVQPLIC